MKRAPVTRLSDLAGNPRNPNRIADPDKARLLKSLLVYGDLSGVIYNRRTSSLVGGHHRAALLKDGTITITERFNKPTTALHSHGVTP